MRRWIIRLALLAAVVAIAIGVRAWFLKPEPIEVTVTTVESGTVEETITNTRAGTVKAHRRTRLSPESGGMALAIPFDEGQMVKQGDVLLRLDDSMPRAQLAARAARARGRKGAPETELRAGRTRAAGGRSHPAPLRREGLARGRPRRSARGGRRRPGRVRSLGVRRRPRRRRGPPDGGRGRPHGAQGSIRRRRGRDLDRARRVDVAVAARAADPAGDRPHRSDVDLRQRADGRGGRGAPPPRACAAG